MSRDVVLTAGDWRAGVDLDTVEFAEELVADSEEIDEWPLMDSEQMVVKLTNLLDAYDKAFAAVATA